MRRLLAVAAAVLVLSGCRATYCTRGAAPAAGDVAGPWLTRADGSRTRVVVPDPLAYDGPTAPFVQEEACWTRGAYR